MMAAEDLLESYSKDVDRRLEELIPPQSQPPTELHAAMRYSCLAPGKRLRPALCIASAQAVDADGPGALDAACGIELVHCFSLIHDDLPAIDDDDLRRGRETCHVRFGQALAILAGDALFALAYQVLSECPAHPERILKCVQALARAAGSEGLVGGEVADVLSEGLKPSPETVAFVHSRKTGALISASCEIGGLIGGASEQQLECLRRYGSHVGLAFQIADDILNETSTPEALGKSAGSDRVRLKATYPAVYGMEASQRAAREEAELGIASLGPLADSHALVELARYSASRLR